MKWYKEMRQMPVQNILYMQLKVLNINSKAQTTNIP